MPPTVTVHDTALAGSAAEVLAVAVRSVEGRPRASGAPPRSSAAAWASTWPPRSSGPAPRARPARSSTCRSPTRLSARPPAAARRRRGRDPAGRRAGPAPRWPAGRAGVASVATDAAGRARARGSPGLRRGRAARGVPLPAPTARATTRGRPRRARRPAPAGGRRTAAPVAAPSTWPRSPRGPTHLARDLANTPSQLKDPAWLARQARDLGRRRPASTCAVRDEQALAAEGFGGLLAVGGGLGPPAAAGRAVLPARPAAPRRARTSCWSARASPSTPAASRSSRARRWCR